MAYKGILFDMDGTLVDSEKHYTEGTYEWLQREGFSGALSEVYPIVGTTMEDTYAFLQELCPFLSTETIRQKNDSFFLSEKPLPYASLLFADVRKNLTALKEEGYRLALCSLSGDKEVQRFLKESRLAPYFEVVLAREDCSQMKPHPEIWQTALRRMNLDRTEVITVEDSENGILSGKNAGIFTWARKDKRFGINQKQADACFEDLSEVLKWLKEKKNERR